MPRTPAHVSDAATLKRRDLIARLERYRSRLVAEGRVVAVSAVDAAIREARAGDSIQEKRAK